LLLPAAAAVQVYDYDYETFSGGALYAPELDFAQLMWKNSKRVGCAPKICRQSYEYENFGTYVDHYTVSIVKFCDSS
jgi:hypothetical protein